MISSLHNTTWKGSKLRIEHAKDLLHRYMEDIVIVDEEEEIVEEVKVKRKSDMRVRSQIIKTTSKAIKSRKEEAIIESNGINNNAIQTKEKKRKREKEEKMVEKVEEKEINQLYHHYNQRIVEEEEIKEDWIQILDEEELKKEHERDSSLFLTMFGDKNDFKEEVKKEEDKMMIEQDFIIPIFNPTPITLSTKKRMKSSSKKEDLVGNNETEHVGEMDRKRRLKRGFVNRYEPKPISINQQAPSSTNDKIFKNTDITKQQLGMVDDDDNNKNQDEMVWEVEDQTLKSIYSSSTKNLIAPSILPSSSSSNTAQTSTFKLNFQGFSNNTKPTIQETADMKTEKNENEPKKKRRKKDLIQKTFFLTTQDWSDIIAFNSAPYVSSRPEGESWSNRRSHLREMMKREKRKHKKRTR